MNQSEYLNLSRKRKRTTKQIDEEREKVLGKNRKEVVDRRGIVRTWQGPTKRNETIRDRIANKLDEGHGSSGDFHKSGTKNVGMGKAYSQPKSMKHKGRSR